MTPWAGIDHATTVASSIGWPALRWHGVFSGHVWYSEISSMNNEWATKALAQSAYLLCQGYKLLRLDGQLGSRIFVFEMDENLPKDAQALYINASCSVQLFYAAFCNLKRLMHSL
jgi:Domain of unknown function (DUF5659)